MENMYTTIPHEYVYTMLYKWIYTYMYICILELTFKYEYKYRRRLSTILSVLAIFVVNRINLITLQWYESPVVSTIVSKL